MIGWDGDDYPSCEYCGGTSHSTDEHDESPEEAGIPWTHFGTLYHGTSQHVEGGILDPDRTSSTTYNTQRMAGNYGRGVYATTAFPEAKFYAGESGTVHEVEPHPDDHGPYSYQVDPMGGRYITNHNGINIRDAAELREYQDDDASEGISLIFPGRMISKRQFRIDLGEDPWTRRQQPPQ